LITLPLDISTFADLNLLSPQQYHPHLEKMKTQFYTFLPQDCSADKLIKEWKKGQKMLEYVLADMA
jgi:hypothetical protein